MNIFDIIITALLLFGFVRGFIKGLFVEMASLSALIGGVYGAIHFSYLISDLLQKQVAWKTEYISLVAFAITFIVIIVVVSLVGKGLTRIANFASLGIINKALGGLFGLLKIGLILSVVFIFFGKMNDTIPFMKKETLQESILFGPVKKIAPMLFPSIINGEIEEKTTPQETN